MDKGYAYEHLDALDVDDVPEVASHHAGASSSEVVASSPLSDNLAALEPHFPVIAAGVVALLLLVFALLFRSFFCDRRENGKPRPRTAMPAFDVEGGSSSNGTSGSKVLHPSITQAAKAADVATLREWMGDDRCVIDAALAATGRTALHEAAAAGHANVVRLLLDGGADALVIDGEFRTPLHLVAVAGHGLCVKALLDAGADPDSKDGQGCTPLALAEQAKHMGTARMMKLHRERRAENGHAARRR